jgi:hypothetical protein
MNPCDSGPGPTEEQISLLQKLAESLAKAQEALLGCDLQGLNEHTVLQSNVCQQLRALRQIPSAGRPAQLDPRWRELAQKLAQAERRVRHLNGVYGALLRRAARSVQITQNLFRNAHGTYHPLDSAGTSISPPGSI